MTPRNTAFLRAFVPGMIAAALAAPSTSAQGAPAGSSGWALRLGLEEAFETNVRFRLRGSAFDEPESDFVTRLRTSLARTYSGTRGAFTLSGEVAGFAYARLGDLNGVAGGVSFAGTRTLSSRFTASLTDAFDSGYARDLRALTDEGLVLPRVRTNRNDAGATLRFTATERLSLAAEVRHEWVQFESTDDEEARALSDGTQLRARFGATRIVTPRHRATLAYGYGRNRNTREGTATRLTTYHSLTGGWVGGLGRRWTGEVSGGASFLQLEGTDESRITPTVGAGLTGAYERTRIEARYAREVRNAFGFGRSRILNRLSLGVEREAGPRTRLTSAFVYAFGGDPDDPSFDIETLGASLGLTRTLSRRWDLGCTYGYARELVSAEPGRDNHSVEVALRYLYAW